MIPTLDLDIIAAAIRSAQNRISADSTIQMAAARHSQQRGVRRAAAALADAIPETQAKINFLIACGYGA